jgi:DNA-binding response OmpR family regulator
MLNPKPKILVVDDEPEITNALKDFLCRKGFEASGVFSAEEALSALEKEKADLILLDIKLPGMQGTEVARIIKERYPAVKIIVVTAYAEETKRLEKDNLLEGWLLKPVKLNVLYHRLLGLCEVEAKKTALWIKTRLLLTIIELLRQDSRYN